VVAPGVGPVGLHHGQRVRRRADQHDAFEPDRQRLQASALRPRVLGGAAEYGGSQRWRDGAAALARPEDVEV
jgi:hypothetical protein